MPLARTPVWKAIASALRSDIVKGSYGPGNKLPAESALATRFGVNRHTVRHAISALAEDGLVHTRRGAGVFVVTQPTDYAIGRRVRFHQNIRAAGQAPSKKVLSLETRAAQIDESDALGLEGGAPVHVYSGLSLSDGLPVALFCSAFCATRFPDLLEHLAENPSITAALGMHGLTDYTRASTRVNAKLATATQALHLQISEHEPVLRTISVNVDSAGKPVEFGRTWFAGDKVTLTLNDD